MSAKQRREAKYMECPFRVRYDYGYWPHDFYAANYFFQRYSIYHLAEGIGNNAEYEAGVWCIVKHGNNQD